MRNIIWLAEGNINFLAFVKKNFMSRALHINIRNNCIQIKVPGMHKCYYTDYIRIRRYRELLAFRY